jgi:uncharacterized RDD family membrane protein YckC
VTDYPPSGPPDEGGSYPPPPPPPPWDAGSQPPGSYPSGGYPPPPPGGYPPPPPGGYPPPPPGGYPPPPGNYPPPPGQGYGQPGYGQQGYGPGFNPAWQGPPLAEWAQRALATLVDWGLMLAMYVAIAIVAAIIGNVSGALGALVAFVGYLGVFAFLIWQLIIQGQTGQTIGKRAIGIKLVNEGTRQPIGAGMSVVRQIAHFIDGLICYIGYLFPLWDAKKQTLADKILSTVVVTVPKQPFSLTPPAPSY